MNATTAFRIAGGKYWFQRAVIRAIWPRHASKELQRRFDVSERAAQSWALGESDMGARRFSELLIECPLDAERRILRLIVETRNTMGANAGCGEQQQ